MFLNKRVNDRFLVGLIGVVLNARDEILVLEHTYRPAIPHGLPSGWLEEGESIADSMKREVREESGFEVEFTRLLHVETGLRPTRLDIWLLYELVGGEFRASAEVRQGWFAPRERLPPLPRVQREFLDRNWDAILARKPS